VVERARTFGRVANRLIRSSLLEGETDFRDNLVVLHLAALDMLSCSVPRYLIVSGLQPQARHPGVLSTTPLPISIQTMSLMSFVYGNVL
jgi:hypothetical protein